MENRSIYQLEAEAKNLQCNIFNILCDLSMCIKDANGVITPEIQSKVFFELGRADGLRDRLFEKNNLIDEYYKDNKGKGITSKQAIKTIENCLASYGALTEESDYALKKIKNDIDVLEIIHKACNENCYGTEFTFNLWNIGENDLNKVKKWFEKSI